MEKQEFITQVRRLVECYGEKAYPEARRDVFWKTFSRVPESVFADAVTQCIGERQYAPMLKELEASVDEAQARYREASRARAVPLTTMLQSAAEHAKSRDLAKFCVGVIDGLLQKKISPQELQEADKQITSWIRGLAKERGETSSACNQCGGDGYVRLVREKTGSGEIARCDCAEGGRRSEFADFPSLKLRLYVPTATQAKKNTLRAS